MPCGVKKPLEPLPCQTSLTWASTCCISLCAPLTLLLEERLLPPPTAPIKRCSAEPHHRCQLLWREVKSSLRTNIFCCVRFKAQIGHRSQQDKSRSDEILERG